MSKLQDEGQIGEHAREHLYAIECGRVEPEVPGELGQHRAEPPGFVQRTQRGAERCRLARLGISLMGQGPNEFAGEEKF